MRCTFSPCTLYISITLQLSLTENWKMDWGKNIAQQMKISIKSKLLKFLDFLISSWSNFHRNKGISKTISPLNFLWSPSWYNINKVSRTWLQLHIHNNHSKTRKEVNYTRNLSYFNKTIKKCFYCTCTRVGSMFQKKGLKERKLRKAVNEFAWCATSKETNLHVKIDICHNGRHCIIKRRKFERSELVP